MVGARKVGIGLFTKESNQKPGFAKCRSLFVMVETRTLELDNVRWGIESFKGFQPGANGYCPSVGTRTNHENQEPKQPGYLGITASAPSGSQLRFALTVGNSSLFPLDFEGWLPWVPYRWAKQIGRVCCSPLRPEPIHCFLDQEETKQSIGGCLGVQVFFQRSNKEAKES